jgi:hypothetical protein
MDLAPEGWTFPRGDMPYLATTVDQIESGGPSGDQLFPTLSVPQDGAAFASAAIRWGPDGDTFAVWHASWSGTGQPNGLPAADRVYLGQVSSGRLITEAQAIDSTDVPDGYRIIDVSLARTGSHPAITIAPVVGEDANSESASDPRHTESGGNPGSREPLQANAEWTGPAAYGGWS